MQRITFAAASCAADLVVALPGWFDGKARATERAAPVVETLELVPIPGNSGTFEVYGAIRNASMRPVRLVSVGGTSIASVADVVGRHGLPLAVSSLGPSITLPPNSELLLLERGLHLVATSNATEHRADLVVMELTFDDGTTRSIDAPVLPAGTPPTNHHHEP